MGATSSSAWPPPPRAPPRWEPAWRPRPYGQAETQGGVRAGERCAESNFPGRGSPDELSFFERLPLAPLAPQAPSCPLGEGLRQWFGCPREYAPPQLGRWEAVFPGPAVLFHHAPGGRHAAVRRTAASHRHQQPHLHRREAGLRPWRRLRTRPEKAAPPGHTPRAALAPAPPLRRLQRHACFTDRRRSGSNGTAQLSSARKKLAPEGRRAQSLTTHGRPNLRQHAPLAAVTLPRCLAVWEPQARGTGWAVPAKGLVSGHQRHVTIPGQRRTRGAGCDWEGKSSTRPAAFESCLRCAHTRRQHLPVPARPAARPRRSPPAPPAPGRVRQAARGQHGTAGLPGSCARGGREHTSGTSPKSGTPACCACWATPPRPKR